MSGTSMPRAATSVATSTRSWPRRSAVSVRLRAPWCMSPCRAPAEKPVSVRRSASESASRFVAVKTMACLSVASRSRWSSNCCLCDRSSVKCRRSSIWLWSIRAAAISMRCGSRIMRSASCSMRRSMVAENISIWRDAGVAPTMASMSSAKPMSSMRSASSKTSMSSADRSMRPESMWSSRRPGVAMMMSGMRASMSSCLG